MFALLGEKPQGASCPAIDGIIKEANEVAGDIADKSVLDAALIASAQAVEHYEITRYGTLVSWSNREFHDFFGRFQPERAQSICSAPAILRISLLNSLHAANSGRARFAADCFQRHNSKLRSQFNCLTENLSCRRFVATHFGTATTRRKDQCARMSDSFHFLARPVRRPWPKVPSLSPAPEYVS